ncbi:MAG: hypothetical protein ACRCUT_10840 [Spirochaetota bacterium]
MFDAVLNTEGEPMIAQNDEFLHDADAASDWEEKYRIILSDKKTKVFGFADITLGTKGICETDSLIYVDGKEYSFSESAGYEHKSGAKAVSGKGIKYKSLSEGKAEFAVKHGPCDARFQLSPAFPAFDFPFSPGKAPDSRREDLESRLIRHYEQRCRVSGEISIKNGPSKKIDCIAQREHYWGSVMWKNLTAFSRYHVIFKDMTISLVYMNYEGTVVSNGFISRRTGNIPIVATDLEHLEINREKLLVSSEMSYHDSQDDKDLVVSSVLFKTPIREIKPAKKRILLFRNFSEFMVIGANKKGIGLEEHYVVPDKVGDFVSAK